MAMRAHTVNVLGVEVLVSEGGDALEITGLIDARGDRFDYNLSCFRAATKNNYNDALLAIV